MNKQRLKLLATGALAVGLFSGPALHAQTVDSVLQQSKDNTAELARAQERITGVVEQTDRLVADYKVVAKQIEGLKVYNAQQELLIADQRAQLATLEVSIANAAAGRSRRLHARIDRRHHGQLAAHGMAIDPKPTSVHFRLLFQKSECATSGDRA